MLEYFGITIRNEDGSMDMAGMFWASLVLWGYIAVAFGLGVYVGWLIWKP